MTNELTRLQEVLEEQTREISRKATEYERLRLAEEANRQATMRLNEINEQRIETMNAILAELRMVIHLLTYITEPQLQRQEKQLDIILEFIKLIIKKANGQLFSNEIQQQIASTNSGAIDMERQEAVKSLAILRGNLVELKKQEAQFGIRVPIDLTNEIKRTEREIEKLEQQLAG